MLDRKTCILLLDVVFCMDGTASSMGYQVVTDQSLLTRLTEEELLERWRLETETVEDLDSDDWTGVTCIEDEMRRRGLDPTAQAQRS